MRSHKNRRIAIPFVLLLAVAPVLILAFQNCGKGPRLEYKQEPEILSSTAIPKGTYCPFMLEGAEKGAKFLFILDMSASNIGKWNGSRWDMATASDPDGTRFDAINSFIDTCGAGALSQFLVIQFSNAAGLPGSPNDPSSSMSCSKPFASASDAKNLVERMRDIQDTEKDWYSQFINKNVQKKDVDSVKSRFLMYQTAYGKALDCANNLIANDVILNPVSDSPYYIFFMTDGEPQESASPCEVYFKQGNTQSGYECYANESKYKATQLSVMAASGRRTLKLYPYFYYKNNPPGQNALNVLNQMSSPSFVNSVHDVTTESLSTQLCQAVAVPKKVEFRKEAFTVVNLTNMMIDGKLEADSDMDGVADKSEMALGYDPTNSRTIGGILDGVCQKLGGPTQCQAARDAVTCQQKANLLGLTDCDLKVLGIHADTSGTDFGVDSDNDGIPDFVEIVRGMNPNSNDIYEDTDNDGMTNQRELTQGSQITKSESNLDPEFLLSVSEGLVPAQSICIADFSEAWEFVVNHLPTSFTQAYTHPLSSALNMSHAKDENLILITYRLTAVNVSGVKAQIFAAVMPAKVVQGTSGSIVQTIHPISSGDFIKIGEVSP